MYGKHFASMYVGSMVGAGFGPYAVMGYVIANQRPNFKAGFFSVDLNPKILAATFGELESVVQSAIDYLCAPDPQTTTPGEEGRRLVKIGTFAYRVVNGAHYDRIRSEEDRREQNRRAQQRSREKKGAKGGLDGKPASANYKRIEAASLAADERGDTVEAERLQHAPLAAPLPAHLTPVPGNGIPPPAEPGAASPPLDGPDL